MGCGCSSFDGDDSDFSDNELQESQILDFDGDFNNTHLENKSSTMNFSFTGDENEFSDFSKMKEKIKQMKAMQMAKIEEVKQKQLAKAMADVQDKTRGTGIIGMTKEMHDKNVMQDNPNMKIVMPTELEETSMFQKYKTPILIGGGLIVGLVVLKFIIK
tara:strand:+ start:6514 stop:6990 length:477 start_codon:yes stop_codon:yes gene_type:complete